MPRKTPSPPEPALVTQLRDRDARIARLTHSLYLAQMAFFDLAPEEAKPFLAAIAQCRTRQDVYDWQFWAASGILKTARPLGHAPGRAYCPTCGGGVSGPGQEGFAVPVGLERHLLGSHGSLQCVVMTICFDLAIETIAAVDKLPEFRLRRRSEDGPKPWMPELRRSLAE